MTTCTMRRSIAAVAVAATFAMTGLTEAGVALPVTEGFDNNNANWTDGAGSPLTWFADGGVNGMGDGYVSTSFNFMNSLEGDQVTLFRGEANNNASNSAFVGDWIASGVTEFSFSVRHNHVAPLFFFARMANPNNFPAAVGLDFTPVMPNTWTEITIDISEMNPFIILEAGDGSFIPTFSNIGNLQLGLEVPASLAGFPAPITFDLDNVSLVPAPGAAALLFAAGLFGGRRRRA